MKDKKRKRTKLTVLLLKEGKINPKDYLLNRNSECETRQLQDGIKVHLFASKDILPEWSQSFLLGRIQNLYKTNIGAAIDYPLVIDGITRHFLITFGIGRFKVNMDACEPQFGLRVALSLGDPQNIRAVETKNISSIPKHVQEQQSRLNKIGAFSVNIQNDVLRKVTLASADETLGRTLTGGEAFSFSTGANIEDIDTTLKQIYGAYVSNKYKENGFGWIDNIKIVKSEEQIKELEAILIAKLRDISADYEGIVMAPPEIINWENAGGFSKYSSRNSDLSDDIRLEQFFPNPDEIQSVDDLKDRRVYLWNRENAQCIKSWNLYKCLEADLEIKKENFILSGGDWYKINKDYYDEVDAWFAELPIKDSNLPVYRKIKKENGTMAHSEGKYNEKCAREGCYELIDRKLIGGRPHDTIEPCDLYSENTFIHIKIYDGSSVPMSHLVNQAHNATEVFLKSREFRKQFNNLLKHKIPEEEIEKPDRNRYSVVLGIITKHSKLKLPFFSKLALKHLFESFELMNIGDNLRIERIQGEW